MYRLFLPYNKTILKLNIVFSIFLTAISISASKSALAIFSDSVKTHPSPVYLILGSYLFWILTGGFLMSAYYFEIARINEYYFYYNIGLSRIRLLLFTYLLHIIIVVPILFIIHYVKFT